MARSIAVVCVLLVLCLTFAEVVHLHPNQGASTPCQICVTAHTTVVAISVVVLPLMLALAVVVVPLPIRLHSVYAGFELFIRPPPSA